MLVAENSQVVGLNEAAAALFRMTSEDILGQRWAGLDAQSTLMGWKGKWGVMSGGERLVYRTDIETSRQFLRPVEVEARTLDGTHALLLLTDHLAPTIGALKERLADQATRAGFIVYNRVDGSINFSDGLRALLELPTELATKDGLISHLGDRMAAADLSAVVKTVENLLAAPTELTVNFAIETEHGTRAFRFSATSAGNELHVTHVVAAVQTPEEQPGASKVPADVETTLAKFCLQRSKDLIFWVRPDGTMDYVNEVVLDRLGYTPDEVTALHTSNIAPAFSQENVDAYFAELRRHKRIEGEYLLISKNGDEVPVAGTANYIRIGDEEYSCTIARDLRGRKRLTRQQRLLEFSFDRSEDMIIWSRPDGSVYSANSTFFEQTGYEREEVQRLNVHELYAEPFDQASIWQRLQSGEGVTRTTRLRTADGRVLPVKARLTYINYEGEELKCAYIYDVSGEREKDKMLSLSRAALDTAADSILWLDEEYRVQYANQTLRQLLPASMVENVVGQSVQNVLPDLDRKALSPGQSQDFDFKTASGELQHMNLTCSLLEHDGQTYFVLSARDISTLRQERQELETEFREIEVMRDRLRDENLHLREDNDTKYNVNNIITVSRKYQKILTQVGQVADVDTTVLITGETGTGKELLARAVHQLSAREDFPLIKVNCAALPESLIESELFGHEKGAFTGAVSRKKGRFEMADRGTIFLDEIGELPLDLQSKLLRVLQEDEFERLGGETTIKVDVRLIAATNRNLRQMVREGKFREDLYYRLNVFPIHNLPLRDRKEDIPVLIEYFAKKYAKRQGKQISRISAADIKRLSLYDFPGNIRELENIMERSVVLCQGETLSIDFYPNAREAVSQGASPFLTFEDMQRKHIIDALKKTGGRVTGPDGAGVLLDVNDRTLVSKMRKLGIEKQDYLSG